LIDLVAADLTIGRVDFMDDLARCLARNPSRILQHLARHVLALTWVDVPTGAAPNADRQGFIATGFFLATGKCCYWVTAGHVITAIQQRFNSGRQPTIARFLNGWQGTGRPHVTPFPLMALPHFSFDHETFGFDFGAILLDTHLARLLVKAGAVPLRPSMWASRRHR
jgi:hypothetical protein